MRSGLVDLLRCRVPGVELDDVHLRRCDERLGRVDLEQWRVAWPERRVQSLDAREARLQHASGRTARRSRPWVPCTSEHGRPCRCGRIHSADRLVVADQVDLLEAGRRIDDPISVRYLDAIGSRLPRRPPRGGTLRQLHASHAQCSLPACPFATPRTKHAESADPGVHSANSTSATSCGLTHRSLPARRRDQRPGFLEPACIRSSVDLQSLQLVLESPCLRGIPTGTDFADRPEFAPRRRTRRAAGCQSLPDCRCAR